MNARQNTDLPAVPAGRHSDTGRVDSLVAAAASPPASLPASRTHGAGRRPDGLHVALSHVVRDGELVRILSLKGSPFQRYTGHAEALCEYVRAVEATS